MDQSPARAGQLFVVSTPIGNLSDITHRALEVLGRVAVVLAEDTRHSRPLLAHFGISTRAEAYHAHNEASATPRALARLLAGDDLALITDAGTPLLSDPGARLVQAAIEAGVDVVPVPGASALLAALVASGLAAERFTFFGFLPRRGRARQGALAEIAALPHTAILYEAPPRLVVTLHDLAQVAGGERSAVVARELTKRYEEIRRGTLDALAAYYTDAPPRGEIVVLVAGAPATMPDQDAIAARAAELHASGQTVRDAARVLAREFGVGRNEAYRVAQAEAAGRGEGQMEDES